MRRVLSSSRAARRPKPASQSTARMRPTMPTGIPTQGMTKRKMIPMTTSASATPITGSRCPAPAVGKLPLDDDEPFFGHFVDGVGGAFLRVAGALDAAVGHLVGAEGGGFVDGDAAEVERLGR